jgi:hypothetical protein
MYARLHGDHSTHEHDSHITLYSITMACSRLAHTIEILYMYYTDLQQSYNYTITVSYMMRMYIACTDR